MERRKRSTRNAALAPELVWRIKQLIIEEQWSPRRISGVLKKEGVSVSHQCIYNLIHADASGKLARQTRHKLKYSADPNTSVSPLRQNVHSLASRAAGGKRFGDFEMDLIVDPHNHAILTIVTFHKPALHDQTCPWEEVRAVGQSRQTSAAALQETHQDHHHRQRS